MIITEQREDGLFAARTDDSPFMEVVAVTPEIATGIIERFRVWYAEREVARAQREVVQALGEVIDLGKLPQVKPGEDTAPSEITVYDESPYMSGC